MFQAGWKPPRMIFAATLAGLIMALVFSIGCGKKDGNPVKPPPPPPPPTDYTPTVPTSLQASQEPKGAVKLTWSPSTSPVGVKRYHILIDANPPEYPNARTYTTTTTSFIDDQAPSWRPSTYRVAAANDSGVSNYTSPASFTPVLTLEDVVGWWEGGLGISDPISAGTGPISYRIFPDSSVIGVISPALLTRGPDFYDPYVVGRSSGLKFTGIWRGQTIDVQTQPGYFAGNEKQRLTSGSITMRQTAWNRMEGQYYAAGIIYFTSTAGSDSIGAGNNGLANAHPVSPLAQSCEVSTTNLDFGIIPITQTKDLLWSVANMGGGTISGSLTTTSTAFQVIGATDFNLGYAESATFRIRFAPTVGNTGYYWVLPFTGCQQVTVHGQSQ